MDRVVVVTGATGRIGRAVVEQFAAQGDALALLARDPQRLDALASDLVERGVRTLALPTDLSGWTIYADPPYLGDGSRKITGYPHGTCSRETVLRLAREWSDRGAVVGISECVGLAGALGAGWHEVEITHGRRGQKRTFSVQNEEWLTMNTPPQHAPHRGQVGLFVQTASLSFGGAAHSASSGAPD